MYDVNVFYNFLMMFIVFYLIKNGEKLIYDIREYNIDF